MALEDITKFRQQLARARDEPEVKQLIQAKHREVAELGLEKLAVEEIEALADVFIEYSKADYSTVENMMSETGVEQPELAYNAQLAIIYLADSDRFDYRKFAMELLAHDSYSSRISTASRQDCACMIWVKDGFYRMSPMTLEPSKIVGEDGRVIAHGISGERLDRYLRAFPVVDMMRAIIQNPDPHDYLVNGLPSAVIELLEHEKQTGMALHFKKPIIRAMSSPNGDVVKEY